MSENQKSAVGGTKTDKKFRDPCGYRLSSAAYLVTVDGSRDLPAMITAGHYDWIDKDVDDQHFPLTVGGGKTQVHVEAVQYAYFMTTTEGIIADLARHDFRPATLAELLALGEQVPELQREFPILSLDQVWRDVRGKDVSRCYPCLDASLDKTQRYLKLFVSPGIEWSGHVYRVLAVPL